MYIEADKSYNIFGGYEFIDSIFNNNTADPFGHSGAIFFEGVNLVDFKNCTISNNEARQFAGAIYLQACAEINFFRTNFTNNKAF